ncbi:MacB-like periplasmic core domain [Butyrivibrio sp. Su6]|nr:MacB-like periplasmic core domain [Butyrivibrio sp. Su6]
MGLYFASSTVRRASLYYIDEQNFRDFDISSSIGIKQQDVDKIKSLPEVKDAEGQITFYGIASFLENNSSVTIVSITKNVSIPTVTSGSLPTAPNECAISYSASQKIRAGIGDEIALEVSSARFSDVLPNKTYKITGIASHPDYMVNTSTDYVVLPTDSFDVEDLSFDYSNILVDADVSVSSFEHAYQDRIQEIKTILEKESVSIADKRATSILSDLEQEYESAELKIRDELANGKAEIDKNRKVYEDAIAKALEALQLGEKEFEEKKAAAEKELSEAARKIREGEEEYNTQIADGQAQLEQGEKDMEKELNDTKYKLFYGMLELAMLIALALGVPLTGRIIQSLETDAFMFVREPFAMAWTASVLINTLFSVVINYLAFSKVNKVPLTDIAKY